MQKDGPRTKRLYIIGGTMGIGKTTVCRILKKELDNAVFLDGDWCWDADPFRVTDETKTMAIENICFVLNNFIHCSAYENIIFCWVMHEQSVIDELLSRLDITGCDVKTVSMVCSGEALKSRLRKDVLSGLRKPDIIERSVLRLPLYNELSTVKVDVSALSPEEAADIIRAL